MSAETTGAIAERYSAALFELAEEQGCLDQVAADLKAVRAMIAESPDLRRVLRSPVLSREEAQKGISAIAQKAGLSALTGRFLGLIARNRRLFGLEGMITAYLARLAAKRGEVVATVLAAAPLSDPQVAALTAALKPTVPGGRIAVDVKVDPSLLGGLVVQVGSRMVDSSLRTKLQRLQLAMKGVG